VIPKTPDGWWTLLIVLLIAALVLCVGVIFVMNV